MAKPIYNPATQKAIGVFIAIRSQASVRAPLIDADVVAKLGCIAGALYNVYAALKIDNVVWLLLESQVANTPEWVREKTETGGSVKSAGVYLGTDPLVIL
jgi:hypothetical protein